MKQNNKGSAVQIVRAVLQIVFFIFLPGLYIQTFSGLKQLFSALIHMNFSAGLWPQLIEAVIIVPVTIIAGRFFCGWMCAFGSFTDLIYRLSQKIFHKKITISEKCDHGMKYIKYGILLVLIAGSWTLNSTLVSSASPWDAFGMIATAGKAPDFQDVFANLAPGFVIFLIIVIISAFTERFFCRYLCPMGAIFSLVSGLRTARIKKPSAHCGSCRACTNSCTMGIPLYKMDTVSGGECIDCMKCVAACPRGNVSLSVAKSDVRPLAAGVTAAAVMAGFYYTAGLTLNRTAAGTAAVTSQTVQTDSTDTVQASSSESSSGAYKDGTYQGSGTGFRGGATKVTVVVSGGKITTINVDSSEDTPNFFNAAYSTVSEEIIRNQSTEVDAVSGATYSSRGIMEAVADALKSATA